MDGVAFDMDPGFTVSQIAGRSTSAENCLPYASICEKSWANLHRAPSGGIEKNPGETNRCKKGDGGVRRRRVSCPAIDVVRG